MLLRRGMNTATGMSPLHASLAPKSPSKSKPPALPEATRLEPQRSWRGSSRVGGRLRARRSLKRLPHKAGQCCGRTRAFACKSQPMTPQIQPPPQESDPSGGEQRSGRFDSVDIQLVCVCWLTAAAAVYLSADGCEKVSMIFWAIIGSAIITIAGLTLVSRRWRAKNFRSFAVLNAGTCLGVIISVAVWHWPLRVSYRLSRNAFDSFAERVRAGDQLSLPQQVGFFTIKYANVSDQGIVCLWTMTDPTGSTGFVQCGQGYIPFNLWSEIKLDDHWQFISED